MRFGGFQLDLQSGELFGNGKKNRLLGQPLQLLELLLQKPGQIFTREQIQQHLWKDGTVVEFEHSVNAAVKRLREALGDNAEKPAFIETIPRRGYRFIASVEDATPVVGPGALPSNTAGQAKAVSIARPAEQTGGVAKAGLRPRIFSVAFAAAAGLALLLALYLPSLHRRAQGNSIRPKIQSLAVLPLENLSGDPAQEYFADGMTDALITDLAQISSLRVISRTSVVRYKGQKKSLPEIARELNVDAVVEGSVVRSSNRVRITAQLIQAVPEHHLWASAYERAFTDVVALEGDVARAIASEVQVKLTPQVQARLSSPRPAVNPEAYEAYLRGRSLLFSFGSPEKAAEYFKTAIEKDPNHAAAFAGLSYSYVLRGGDPFSGREAMVLAEAAARKALALDETLAEAHAALGAVKYRYQWDWQGAEAEFRRASARCPA